MHIAIKSGALDLWPRKAEFQDIEIGYFVAVEFFRGRSKAFCDASIVGYQTRLFKCLNAVTEDVDRQPKRPCVLGTDFRGHV